MDSVLLYERRLKPLRQVAEALRRHGVDLPAVKAGLEVTAGFQNALGLDKGPLVLLLRIVDRVERYAEIEAPWDDPAGMRQRIAVACELAGFAVQLTKSGHDDDLVRLLLKLGGDATLQDALLNLCQRLGLPRPWESLSAVEISAALAQGPKTIDAGDALLVLPYVAGCAVWLGEINDAFFATGCRTVGAVEPATGEEKRQDPPADPPAS